MKHSPQRKPARFVFAAACVMASLALGGCGSSGKKAVATASSTPAGQASEDDNWMGREGVKEAIALLNQGRSVEARKHLMAVLKEQPGDTIARQLVTQIDSDPKILLGVPNYSYTVKEGESLSSIAQRALGNPMMFYALARYNDIAVPSAVAPGQTILVPGKRPAPVKAAKKAPPKREPETKEAATAVKPAVSTPKATVSPARAAKFRGQGLAALNSGAIDRAVALFRQALSLDPSSGVIKADLNRALRIQSTVRSRP